MLKCSKLSIENSVKSAASAVIAEGRKSVGRFRQARRNVFVSGGYKFVQTLHNLVVKVVLHKDLT